MLAEFKLLGMRMRSDILLGGGRTRGRHGRQGYSMPNSEEFPVINRHNYFAGVVSMPAIQENCLLQSTIGRTSTF